LTLDPVGVSSPGFPPRRAAGGIIADRGFILRQVEFRMIPLGLDDFRTV